MNGHAQDRVWFVRATTGKRRTTLTPWARQLLETNEIPEAEREQFIREYRRLLTYQRSSTAGHEAREDHS